MKTVILCPGQGTQHPGMLKDLFIQYPEVNKLFDLAKKIYGRDIYRFILETTQEELNKTQNTQPCLVVCELAILHILRQLSIPFDAVAGFSLGEWTALVASGAASEEDVLAAVAKRADAMQRSVSSGGGGMAVILGKDAAFVDALCVEIGDVFPANYNCAGNITVAGTEGAIDRLIERAKKEGIMASRVAISVPAHCPLMEPAAREMMPVIEALPIKVPSYALYMNATGSLSTEPKEIRKNLLLHLSHPVRFAQTVESLLNAGYDTFLEAGPGKVLSGMVKRTAKQKGILVKTFRLDSTEGMNEVRGLFAG